MSQNIHSDFEEFQRWRANQPASSPEKRINATDVRLLCGVSDMTIWRWLKNSNFPKPAVINRRRYWRKVDVLDWLESHQQQNTPSLPRAWGNLCQMIEQL